MIIKLVNIIKGWYRYLFKNQSDLAKNRVAICKRCSYKEEFMGHEVCSLCGCQIYAKAEVEEEFCDDKRW